MGRLTVPDVDRRVRLDGFLYVGTVNRSGDFVTDPLGRGTGWGVVGGGTAMVAGHCFAKVSQCKLWLRVYTSGGGNRLWERVVRNDLMTNSGAGGWLRGATIKCWYNKELTF